MTTTQTPGPAGSAIATQLTGSGIHPPGPSAEDQPPGARATPAPAAAAPARPSESRVGSITRPAGVSFPVVLGDEPTPGSAVTRGGAACESPEPFSGALAAGDSSDPRAREPSRSRPRREAPPREAMQAASGVGPNLHDPEQPRPKPMPLPPPPARCTCWSCAGGLGECLSIPPRGFDLPLRASTPRFERTCPCLGCKPFVSG